MSGTTTATCRAVLYIGDDYQDNHATMGCQREEGHDGPHVEMFRSATLTWTGDDGPVDGTDDEPKAYTRTPMNADELAQHKVDYPQCPCVECHPEYSTEPAR